VTSTAPVDLTQPAAYVQATWAKVVRYMPLWYMASVLGRRLRFKGPVASLSMAVVLSCNHRLQQRSL
jgi:hypothetical protein